MLAGDVARDLRTLPDGWEKPIPDAIWPEALISAVRHDASALASDRVIRTIKLWQTDALDESDARAQIEARRMLRKLADALSPEVAIESFDADAVTTHLPGPELEEEEDGTIDALELPPKPKVRRASRMSTPRRRPLTDEEDTDYRTKRQRSLSGVAADDAIVEEAEADSGSFKRTAPTGASKVAEGEFSEEDEKPTTALPHPTSSGPKHPPSGANPSKPAPPAPPPLPPADRKDSDEEDPTRHIDLPDEVLAKKADSFIRDLGLPQVGSLGPERTEMGPQPPGLADEVHADEEATHALGPKDSPQRLIDDLELAFEADKNPEPLTPMDVPERRGSLAPKPGIIRRRSTKSRRLQSSPRPRAAMHHVRALYFVLMPFAGELIPLPYERRSRRFWGRWREVAGDRGVRREFIEDLLRAANDARTLVCELIAEVQTVDLKSVYALVEKLEQSGELEDINAPPPVGTPERQRGPLVGASVRVEGVVVDEEE